ncbi:MAG: CDP-diacylglycerol--glycerol-3-phosphate 3-phosphatidyltransferase [Ethanoligenens sp.]|uniref:CDP-diacylglycerol--glycerol-3-phosphate 3-phosphatidyltransferase n=1 Tax=Ethanoligenens sp. TaxID=2099655 RepID=UPI0039E83163
MNTPNKLTVFRMVLVPVFMAFALLPAGNWRLLVALAVFIVASVTDLIDGKLARKYNQITTFGKFMDPLADKLLVCAALVVCVQIGLASTWAVVLIIAREFLVTSLRLLAAGSGEVIAANIWGKVKTNSQMYAIILALLIAGLGGPTWIGYVLIWIAAIFTAISGLQYLWAYRAYIDTTK